MKLFIPVAGIIAAIGACCCGDMDEMSEKMEEMKMEEPAPADATAPVVTPTPSSASAAPAGPAAEGSCGRFKDWSVPAPSGLKVIACTDDAGTGSIVMQGTASPADACKALKSWADGTGAKMTLETTMVGVTAIYEKDAIQMTVNCIDMGGQTTASVTLTPKS